jgi:outer membrane lipoprotein-sorting protein
MSINGHFLQVSNLVVGDDHFVVHYDLNIGAVFVCPSPEGVHKVVFFSDKEVVVEFVFITLSKSSLKSFVSWGDI